MVRRALHFVFKVGNRLETAQFYRDVLGMKFLRHEEFEEGCKAYCNGPYDSRWSKSMVGYGNEDDHFVIELTYNYGICGYRLGNDFIGLTIQSDSVLSNAKKHGYPVSEQNVITSPDGYQFVIDDRKCEGDPVKKVSLACSNLQQSINYWSQLCGMNVIGEAADQAELAYSPHQCHLELRVTTAQIDRASAFGRIAFSCPENELSDIEQAMKEAGETILTPLVSLDTPGKASVSVVILADPDGHEICFVGEEAFRELSKTDDNAGQRLDKAINEDGSDEWFKKTKKGKETK